MSKAPKAAEAPAPKALAESTAPVVTVTHEVVRPAKAPERVHAPAKPALPTKVEKVFTQEEKVKFHRLCMDHELIWPEDTVEDAWAEREQLAAYLKRLGVA